MRKCKRLSNGKIIFTNSIEKAYAHRFAIDVTNKFCTTEGEVVYLLPSKEYVDIIEERLCYYAWYRIGAFSLVDRL